MRKHTAASLWNLTLWMLAAAPLQATGLANFDAAKQLAAKQNRPVLLKFGTEWCAPCKQFAREATSQPQLRTALENTVTFFELDAEKGEGIELAKTFAVKSYPTFILTDSRGMTLDRWAGYVSPGDFIATLDDAAKDPLPVGARRMRFAESPTTGDAVRLARIAATESKLQEAADLYARAEALDPAADGKYAFATFEIYAQGYFKGGVFGADVVQKAATAALTSSDVTPAQLLILASTMSGVGQRSKDANVALPFLKAAVAGTASSTDPDIVAGRRAVLVDHALLVESNPAKALVYKREAMPSGWMENSDSLNEFAWWCFENQVNLDEAETLARKGVELAKAGREKAMLLDTAAEICNLRGSCKDAVGLIERAMKEDPKSEYYPKQLERFRKELAAAK